MAERRNDVTPKQRLHLLNSSTLYYRLGRLTDNKAFHRQSPQAMVDTLYWKFLGRPAAPFERQVALAAWRDPARDNRQKWRLPKDIAWCLVNSREFLFRL